MVKSSEVDCLIIMFPVISLRMFSHRMLVLLYLVKAPLNEHLKKVETP